MQYVHKMYKRWGPNVQTMECIRKHLDTQGIKLEQNPMVCLSCLLFGVFCIYILIGRIFDKTSELYLEVYSQWSWLIKKKQTVQYLCFELILYTVLIFKTILINFVNCFMAKF